MSDNSRQWCVVVNSHNPHDFQVWGPYSADFADQVYQRLHDAPGVYKGSKSITMWPMSQDWDDEDARRL